jgi:hypothetical protein
MWPTTDAKERDAAVIAAIQTYLGQRDPRRTELAEALMRLAWEVVLGRRTPERAADDACRLRGDAEVSRWAVEDAARQQRVDTAKRSRVQDVYGVLAHNAPAYPLPDKHKPARGPLAELISKVGRAPWVADEDEVSPNRRAE